MAQLIQSEVPGLELISLTSEVCRRDTCIRGDCRDRLWLDNARLNAIESGAGGFGFIGPGHLRTFECICRQGYAGPNCDVPVNKCSKELCRRVELCIPTSAVEMEGGTAVAEEGIGFNCACPSGFKGQTCSESICPSNARDHEECARQNEAISFLGQGYFELHIAGGSTGSGNGGSSEFAASLESRMELALDFRTVSANAVLMHGQGIRDYHTLRIVNGYVQYEWDCGSGRGLVQLSQLRVDNGIWYRLRMHRIGRLARLTLDNGRGHKAEGTSPPGSDVINLFDHSTVLIFGALVEQSSILRRQLAEALNGTTAATGNLIGPAGKLAGGRTQLTADELRVGVHEGMIGCIGRIALDGVELPKTQHGIRLFNAAIGCDERAMGPCLGSPCRNGGQCIPGKAASPREDGEENEAAKQSAASEFTCQCPARYTGAQCEIDLNACAAHPCPNGIPCHNLYGDFHCSCPAGFTGKTCQLRGDWDPCVTAQCGPNGKCLRQKTTFQCQCQPGWMGPFCMEMVEIGVGMGGDEGGKDEAGDGQGNEEDGPGKWLMEVLKINRLLLMALGAICLLTLALTLGTILLCRHRQLQKRRQRDQRHLNGANRRLKKSATNNGTTLSGSFSKGTTEQAPVMVRGGRRRQQQEGRGGGGANDPASNPLVPRETPAPGQGTADRPPPPLPPRYHRRDANGTALPTVEVKPMPAASNRQQTESQQKLNGQKCGDSDQNGSLKSGQSSQNNGNANFLMGSLRRKSAANGGSKRPTPVPPPRHSSGDLASDKVGDTEQPLRALGRPLTEEEMRELNLSGIYSPGQRASAAGSYGRKIDQACTAAANTQKQKAKPFRHDLASSIPMADADASTSDYLTMKPVHRAKPFMARGNNKANGHKSAKESPPPPPMHRTPLLNGRSSKLYDNPTDACQEEEDEDSPRN